MSGPSSQSWRFSVNKNAEDVAAGDDDADVLPDGIEGVTGTIDVDTVAGRVKVYDCAVGIVYLGTRR